MKKNFRHPLDRFSRVIVGIGLLSLIFFLEGNARWFGLMGIVPILTAYFCWCPGYAVCGINLAKNS
jgi:hypothetical protein